ncbi:competence/damage-inducible protein A [Pseudogracilibacillus sp. ICA-222130]|uniref:competence/damage-inducible protein A n=1 Tax=Pseudogracilibacillus sp. ICA-222130 TaxID=3134655 RepID=UPI0030BA8029
MTRQLNTEIIAVGTELLLGQIANTNAQWLSGELAGNGINTYYHTVVGDNMDRLTAVFERAQQRSNVVLVTGGLGPTQDDLSREAFQQLTDLRIVEEKDSLQKIMDFYRDQGTEMTPNNRRQARVFEGSKVLPNKVGMAPGNLVVYKDVIWIFMPGVPKEMKQIFSDEVIPYLKSINGEMVIESKVLNFTGIGESVLEHTLEELIRTQHNPTIAPLAVKGKITVRVSAKAETKEKALSMIEKTKKEILSHIGRFYFGEGSMTLEEKVFELLKERKMSIASAESLTAGLFTSNIVDNSGASAILKGGVVCYDPAVKRQVLQVADETIRIHGTVSEQCAKELAENVRDILGSAIGISFTGVAGPNEIEGKKAGTVYIGIATEEGTKVSKFVFAGDRKQVRERAVLKGYELLFTFLK